ncbi:MAG: iron-containing alcohol dehydrogenase, partial [Breznakiellaceae bacterium]
MVDFVFKLDPKVIIGTDTINWISKVIEPYGNRVMVVTEPVLYENNVIDRVSQVLSEANIEFIVFDNVPPQATAQVAEEVAELARAARCSVIIGLGGIKTQAIAKIASLVFPAGTYLLRSDKSSIYEIPQPALIYYENKNGEKYIFAMIARSRAGERFIEPSNIVGYDQSFI